MGLWATNPIKFVQVWHLELGWQPCIREQGERIVVHKFLHLTGSSNHLLHFIHPLVDLLLTPYAW